MHSMPHDFHRLYYRGCLGWERRHRQERRYQLLLCALLSVALVAVYWAVGGIS